MKFFTNSQDLSPWIHISDNTLERVFHFNYLGSAIQSNSQARDKVELHVYYSRRAFLSLRKALWSCNEISPRKKLDSYREAVHPVLTYTCETGGLRVDDTKRLESPDHWCLRYIVVWIHFRHRRAPALYKYRAALVFSPKMSLSVVCSCSPPAEDGIDEKEPTVVTLFRLKNVPLVVTWRRELRHGWLESGTFKKPFILSQYLVA